MFKTVIDPFGTIGYELEDPSNVHIKFLVSRASFPIKQFCKYVVDLNERKLQTSPDFIEDIDEYQAGIKKTKDPFVLVDTLFNIIHTMQCAVQPVLRKEDATHLETIIRRLFYVYVLAVVDMCFTMDGEESIIDDRWAVEKQVNLIANHIPQYPHLSNWVNDSIVDWEDALEQNLELKRNSNWQNLESTAWYMTSPTESSTLESLETYVSHGRGE